ncbi:hypothetical protein PIB30_001522 [Stylosanthes scabra]|uniref:Uncharacterized protein n=1 Tax=Stylosanthes scabra TaxID=79078 RepID=A0ABU6R3X8_9FABA|nr:hypothetical protein [Stylosanthes scabra]
MESMETGACLWMVINRNVLVGIRVEKLEQLGKNEARHWKSNLVLPPFDFHMTLPQSDLRHFLLDSKLFFAGGTPHSSPEIHQVSYAGGTTLDIADAVAAGTFPPGPTLLHDCYVANLQGEVYLLANDALHRKREMMGFWVLGCCSSGFKKWHPLSLPPALLSHYDWWHCFVWRDKLYLRVDAHTEGRIFSGNIILYVYDPQTTEEYSWKQLKPPFSSSDRFKYLPQPQSVTPVSSLGDVGNCSVAMAWSRGEWHECKIYALLVDNEQYFIRGYQCLDEVWEAINVDFHDDINTNINVSFADLGKGKVCVVIGGVTRVRPRYSLLCVLVIQLCLQQEEGQRFLSVEVLVNQVYDMLPYYSTWDLEWPCSSFVFSLSKGLSPDSSGPLLFKEDETIIAAHAQYGNRRPSLSENSAVGRVLVVMTMIWLWRQQMRGACVLEDVPPCVLPLKDDSLTVLMIDHGNGAVVKKERKGKSVGFLLVGR